MEEKNSMSKLVIPQNNEIKTKKTYQVEIEGDNYTVIASVLILKDSTKYINRIKKCVEKLENKEYSLDTVDRLYENIINLFEILLGKKKAKQLLKKIDEKYDSDVGQVALIQYSMLLYQVSCGATQEDIDNFFRN